MTDQEFDDALIAAAVQTSGGGRMGTGHRRRRGPRCRFAAGRGARAVSRKAPACCSGLASASISPPWPPRPAKARSRDQLFDLLMSRFDTMKPHREGVARVAAASAPRPGDISAADVCHAAQHAVDAARRRTADRRTARHIADQRNSWRFGPGRCGPSSAMSWKTCPPPWRRSIRRSAGRTGWRRGSPGSVRKTASLTSSAVPDSADDQA